MLKKIRENVVADQISAYVIYEWFLSPGKPDDFPPLRRGGLSVSPYNPNFDEVFQLSSRTPDVSPFRYQPQQQRFGDHGRQSTYSPESDVGYGTSFGSQELGGHTLDMDILSNLVRSLSLNNGLNNGSTSSDPTNSVGMPDCNIGAFGLGGHPPPLHTSALPKSDIEIENDFNLPVNPVESGSPRKQPTVVRFLILFLSLFFLLADSIKI